MQNLHQAIRNLNPLICVIKGNEYEGVLCYTRDGNEIEKPSLEAVQAELLICDLVCCKECKKEEIENAWKAECEAGFTYGGDTFDFDDTTLGIIGARLSYNEAKESPTTADLTFYNSDKVAVVFADKNAFKSFCIAFILARNTIDQKRVSLKAQIDACATKEEVEAIIW